MIDGLEKSVSAYREALEALVTKLDEVHADERYKGVWSLAAAHGMTYKGPRYTVELNAARTALATKETGE